MASKQKPPISVRLDDATEARLRLRAANDAAGKISPVVIAAIDAYLDGPTPEQHADAEAVIDAVTPTTEPASLCERNHCGDPDVHPKMKAELERLMEVESKYAGHMASCRALSDRPGWPPNDETGRRTVPGGVMVLRVETVRHAGEGTERVVLTGTEDECAAVRELVRCSPLQAQYDDLRAVQVRYVRAYDGRP